MGAQLTTVSAITKEIYGPRIVDQLENEITLTKRIEKTSRGTTSEVGGKYVTFPLKVRRNHGIGYRAENTPLQDAGQQGWASVRVPLRYGYGRVRMTGQTIELVNENYQAFASALTEEMEGLKNDIKKDTNRILWGNGLGVLATVDTGATSATISLGTNASAVHPIELDQQVDVMSAVGAVKHANQKVVGVNDATGDITLAGSVTVVPGDVLVRTGNYDLEPKGLAALVKNSGPLFNLDPAVEPKWKSIEDNSGGVISESKMITMCDNLRLNGGRPSVIFTDLASRRAYFNILTAQRRFTKTQEFDGGFTGLAFAYDTDVPVVTDVDAPPGKMWFLREDDFKVYRSKAWHWEDRDGGVWKWVQNYDAFEAMMKQYWEFAIERRNTQGVVTAITPG